MKILYFSPSPVLNLSSPTGYGSHMRGMINAFTSLGHEVLPVIIGGTTLSSEEKKGNEFKNSLKKIIPNLLWESMKDYGLLRSNSKAKVILERKVNDFQPDMIYERAAYLRPSGVEIAKKYQIKHILETNAPLGEEKQLLAGTSCLLKRSDKIEKRQMELTDKVVVVSSSLKKHFIGKYNINPSKFVITPNAVNPAEITTDNAVIKNLRKKNNLQDKLVIGFVGSIFPYHGVDILINAFGTISKKHENVVLLIVGDGKILDELKMMCISLGVRDEVIFTGNVQYQDVFNYIELMDITVLPEARSYMSPIKLFEYGALAKAIIAPDNAPLNDVMINGEDGILIKPNVKKLSIALDRLIRNEKDRIRMAKNFQNKVLAQHIWLKMAEKVLLSLGQ